MSSLASVVRSLLRLSSTSLLHNPKYPYKRFFSSKGSGLKQHQKNSITISYLTKRCKFSEEDAISVAKVVSFGSPTKPDKVIDFFRLRGFSRSQVASVISKIPGVLCMHPHKTLSPKLDFLTSKGFSAAEVRKIFLHNPRILLRSLDAHIIPSFDFIAKVLLSDYNKARSAIRRCPSLLTIDIQAAIVPKIKLLTHLGVPGNNIAFLLHLRPQYLGTTKHDRFERIAHRAVDMGICPSQVSFVIAVQALRQLTKSTWDRKLEAYSRWGWSEEMTLQAFAKCPWVMCISVRKITAVMDYYKNEMGIESSYIAENPVMLSLSLEKRTKPRCSVLRYLRTKGLIGDISLTQALFVCEAKFLDLYVARFPEDSKLLLSIYRENSASRKSCEEKACLSSDHL